jgi:hypothetical protein
VLSAIACLAVVGCDASDDKSNNEGADTPADTALADVATETETDIAASETTVADTGVVDAVPPETSVASETTQSDVAAEDNAAPDTEVPDTEPDTEAPDTEADTDAPDGDATPSPGAIDEQCVFIHSVAESPPLTKNDAAFDGAVPGYAFTPMSRAASDYLGATHTLRLSITFPSDVPAAMPVALSALFLGGYAVLHTQAGMRVEVTLFAAGFTEGDPLAPRFSYTTDTGGGTIDGTVTIDGPTLLLTTSLPITDPIASLMVRVEPNAFSAPNNADFFRAQSAKVALPAPCIH